MATLWRYHRAIAYAWLMRQAGKSKADKHLAKRLVLRHRATIETELVRMGLTIDVPMYLEEITNEHPVENHATSVAS